MVSLSLSLSLLLLHATVIAFELIHFATVAFFSSYTNSVDRNCKDYEVSAGIQYRAALHSSMRYRSGSCLFDRKMQLLACPAFFSLALTLQHIT